MSLIDQHGRVVNYIRLAVTDRCNLRCHYCMPAEGIDYVDRQELLTYEEMERLLIILSREGVDKVRITGGEPFLRKGMMDFLTSLSQIRALDQIHITTNGTLTKDLVPQLKHLGISGINLSLDSLDKERFSSITRRDNFDDVITTLVSLLEHQIPTKINMVVMKDQNLEDIHEMIELSRDKDISVRFIEEMPFNGSGVGFSGLEWNYQRILEHIMTSYGDIEKIQDGPYSTSLNYRIKDFKG
ncbi:MAG: radical SAM protein, partial [Bacteroidia bacterium]|nr:radical SAM protein [Bacteroidia bacterium]